MNEPCFGLYRGIVTDNDDPDDMMRIMVRIPVLFGEQKTGWVLPCVPPGVESIPEIGTVVWIEFEAGDLSRPVWIGTLGSFKNDQKL